MHYHFATKRSYRDRQTQSTRQAAAAKYQKLNGEYRIHGYTRSMYQWRTPLPAEYVTATVCRSALGWGFDPREPPNQCSGYHTAVLPSFAPCLPKSTSQRLYRWARSGLHRSTEAGPVPGESGFSLDYSNKHDRALVGDCIAQRARLGTIRALELVAGYMTFTTPAHPCGAHHACFGSKLYTQAEQMRQQKYRMNNRWNMAHRSTCCT